MINRGSEWRRWELHMHTPETKKEDHYTGQNVTEKWNRFYSTISDYIGDGNDPMKAICAIAITDYLSIDNYFKVCNDRRLPDCVKLVFPNVELRISPVTTSSPINIHCLFDPSIAGELEDRFFSRLRIDYNGGTPYSAKKSELIRLGRVFLNNPNASDDQAYIAGLNQYVISVDTLADIFKKDHELREKTIIVVSNKSNDGASGLRAHRDYFVGEQSQLEASKRAIYQLSDMIYSSNPNDIRYFLGEGVDDIETVKKKCGSLKPCIHGCDAHTNDRVFSPDDNRFCWIKADPTFEGLKQVLYEPKERVRISNTFPDSKPSYYVIDHVEVLNNPKFSPDPIYFSDKLTCIIGGKSTGKSLLLHNIATAIDTKQVQEKQITAKTNVKRVPEFRVFWGDGACSEDKDKQRKIVYVPQTYLNRLSDEEQETTEIDTIIQDIVLQDEECNKAYQKMNRETSAKKQEIAKDIVDFIQIVQERKSTINSCKEIGDEQAITTEIERLTVQLDQLSKEYDVTEDDIKNYQAAVEKVRSLQEIKTSIKKEIDALRSIPSVIEKRPLEHLSVFVCAEQINEAIEASIHAADTMWIEKREQIIIDANKRLQDKEHEIQDNQKIITALRPKMEGNEQISLLSTKILNEKARLTQLKEKITQLNIIEQRYKGKLHKLSLSFDEFSKIYSCYADTINSNFISQSADLEFSARKVFRTEQFKQKLEVILDNRSISRFTAYKLSEVNEAILLPKNLEMLIEALLKNSSESIQLKTSYTIESGLRELLTDWYNIDYAVEMDNDKIQDMSPGKKALVLLRLLISLAESKCPILIDQPEDDLDNRSIFDELISFIREKKVDRQIITVTHNANIVLGGDAELVIVANQDGKNSPNRQYQFEYRGGSIENNTPLIDENGHVLPGILNQKGMQEHICEILEGGERAFDLRRHKYHFINT